nr:EOG090X0CJ3 [Eurycercus lamellatus]
MLKHSCSFKDQGDSSSAPQQNVPSMLSWAYYQRFFDVDTSQVKERLLWSFLPRPSRDTLTNFIRPTPDLYGPFWVCVTLVFCIAIMGNVADYMQSGGEGQHWRYDFRKVSISASTVFSYALLVPLILWAFLWWRRKQIQTQEEDQQEAQLGLMEMISLYGYSLAIYIPISILWAIPYPWIQWTLVIVGAALSGSVLVLSLWKPLSSNQKGLAVILLAVVVTLHFLMAAGLQLYFFRYSNDVTVVAVSSSSGGSSSDSLRSADHKIDHLTGVTPLLPLSLVLEDKPALQNSSTLTQTITILHEIATNTTTLAPVTKQVPTNETKVETTNKQPALIVKEAETMGKRLETTEQPLVNTSDSIIQQTLQSETDLAVKTKTR